MLRTDLSLMRRLRIASNAVIIAQHKPFSLLSPSTRPQGNKRFAVDLLKRPNLRGKQWHRPDPRDLPGLTCAGRLDADSTGLLLWTDDPSLAQYIIGPSTPVEKEYLVRISGHAQWSAQQLQDSLALLREGIHLDGEPLRRAEVRQLNEHQLSVTLREGRHRQIRRMMPIVGLQVDAIKRVRIGGLRLAGLPVGCWSPMSPAQAASLLIAGAGGRRVSSPSGRRRALESRGPD